MPFTEEDVDLRIRAFRVSAWFRLIGGMIVAILVSLLIVNVTVGETQYTVCIDRTNEQLNTAHKDAVDALHARTPAQREAAASAAKNIAAIAGLKNTDIGVLAHIRPGIESGLNIVVRDHCDHTVKRPLPFIT